MSLLTVSLFNGFIEVDNWWFIVADIGIILMYIAQISLSFYHESLFFLHLYQKFSYKRLFYVIISPFLLCLYLIPLLGLIISYGTTEDLKLEEKCKYNSKYCKNVSNVILCSGMVLFLWGFLIGTVLMFLA